MPSERFYLRLPPACACKIGGVFRKTRKTDLRSSLLLCLALLLLWVPQRAGAAFHFAVIDEIMTSYGGDPNVQFVEIRMLAIGQSLVTGTVLRAFGPDGSHLGTVLVVPGNVL